MHVKKYLTPELRKNKLNTEALIRLRMTNIKFGTSIILDPSWGGVHRASESARQLEHWGYDFLWGTDERFGRNVYAVLTLGALNTERVKLGISVTNPYTRHPLITAAAIATINEISDGRAILGLGAGASTLFERQGMPRPHPPLTAIREAIEVMRPFLNGRKISLDGKSMKFRDVNIDFESQAIPIYIAARGPKLLQLAGEITDGVIIGSLASEKGLNFALDNIQIGAERVGRDMSELDIVFWAYTAISDDEDTALNLVKRIVVSSMWSSKDIIQELGIDEEKWRPIEEKLRNGFRRGFEPDKVYGAVYDMLPREVFEAWSVSGTSKKVEKKVKVIINRGIDQFALLPMGQTPNESRAMQKIFADKIIPKLR